MEIRIDMNSKFCHWSHSRTRKGHILDRCYSEVSSYMVFLQYNWSKPRIFLIVGVAAHLIIVC